MVKRSSDSQNIKRETLGTQETQDSIVEYQFYSISHLSQR